MGTLIQTGANLSSPLYLDGLLAMFARHAAEAAHTTFCRIGLLDEAGEVLSIRAVHAIRELSWEPRRAERYRLAGLPKHRMAVETRQAVIVRRDVPLMAIHGEELKMLAEDVKSAALVPLSDGDSVLGVLTLGEMRGWERSPFDSVKMKFLESLAVSISSTLTFIDLLQQIVQAYEHFSSSYEQAIKDESRQAMVKFALRVADDLSQPLTSAWGFSQLLLKDASPADQVRYESLSNIIKSCEKMGTIVENLRMFTYPGV